MSNSDLEKRLLQHVNRPNYRPVKPRVIAKQLNLSESEHRDLKRAIKRLVKKGRIAYGKKHLILPGEAPRRDEVIGRFTRKQAGFGFVAPENQKNNDRAEDVFIPVSKTRDAASGDTVRVRFKRRQDSSGDRRLSGEIIEVLERAKVQFVGNYFEDGGMGFVSVDGGEFSHAVYVGDPGAKNAKEGDQVVIEMVRFPAGNRTGEGVITKVLGQRGEPGVDTQSIIYQYNLPNDFPEEVLENAREQAEAFDESIPAGRVDLTTLTTITIDPFDARDFDDAISLEKLENGHWRLGVHIADVSHFVQPKSALDQEARERGTSVYLPDMVIPMIPELISNNLASLQPDRVRYSKTAFIEFTQEGIRVATDFCTSAIRSDRRFTYEEVDEYLEDPQPWKAKLTPEVFRLVGDMHTLAMLQRKRRLDRGALELSLPDIKLMLDDDGKVVDAVKSVYTESHQIIEEFMLAANEAVAERFFDEELLFLRRIHESPDPLKLEQLTEFVRELGIDCESLESRFEIKRILEKVLGNPEEAAINFATLRSMKKAIYSPKEIGHFALASQHYCHFTSPIRRYPDLTIHRLMQQVFEGNAPSGDFDVLTRLGEHCSDREQRAESAERELKKVKLLTLFASKIGHEMEAVITGVEDFGIFAQGIELPAEGLIHAESLDDDRYLYDERIHALVGRREGNTFRIGDPIRVEIVHVDIEQRELDFRLVKSNSNASKAKKSVKKSRKTTNHQKSKTKKRRR